MNQIFGLPRTLEAHFGHANVIRYSNRPWATVDEMNEGLIDRWNSIVKREDTVYHLGDFCLTMRTELVDNWLGRLNGTIRLIRGNHDKWVRRFERLENQSKIKWIREYAERTFMVDGVKYKFCMSHFPMLTWHQSQHGSIMLHGHCHSSLDHLNVDVRRMDVGVDGHNWYPVALEEIILKMMDRPVTLHHPTIEEKNHDHDK